MPISLGDIAASYREGRSLPPNALAVTVDDGYRDFLTSGQPVLRAFDIPATVFLVSDFIDGGFWLWWDMFAYVVERTSQKELTCSMPDGSTRRFTLNSPAERRAAYATISAELTHFDARVRLRSLAELSGRLEVTVPRDPPSEYAPLTWGDVRSLADQGVEFGAHTRTHPILSCVGDPQQLRDEVISSKLRIEQETGRPVVHFCYPNGRREDFGDDAVEVVREGGFQTAVTTEPGINFPGQPPLLLRRIGVQPDYPIPYVEELLAGVRSS